MKKNKTMRAAAVMVVLAMLSTCLVSGTFAKYVTSGSSNDTARVAKWGVTVSPAVDSAFQKNYKVDDQSATTIGAYSVKSSNEDNVVAPGTEGQLTTVELGGTPEVAVRVTNTAKVSLTGWNVDGADYCPLVVSVGGKAVANPGTVADYEDAIEAAIAACKADYAPGTDLSTKTEACPVVTWKWAFEGNDDVKDTKLGEAGSATVNISITTTVTQIN